MLASVLQRLRNRAHKHTDLCYGLSQLWCGEHHAHDDNCYGRPLICRTAEDEDLIELIKEYDRLNANQKCNCAAIRMAMGTSSKDLIQGHEPDCIATNELA